MVRPRLTGFVPAVLITLCAAEVLAQDSTVVLSETFDTVVIPGLPPGWRTSGTNPWTQSGGVPSSATGYENLTHEGAQPGTVAVAGVDLSVLTSGTLEYLARRTSLYDTGRLVVRASVDGGATYPVVVVPAGNALPAVSGQWARLSARLPPEILGRENVALAFEAQGAGTASANIRIDNVRIAGVSGAVSVLPAALSFATQAGASQPRTLTVANTYLHPVELQAPVLAGSAFSVTPSDAAVLEPGTSRTYTVTFTPPVENTYSGSVTFRHTMGEAVVPLSGSVGTNAAGFSTPASEAVELADTVRIPISLAYVNATALQGLELAVAWDTAVVTLLDVARGPAVANTSAWTLAAQGGEKNVRLALLGNGAAALAAGSYDPLLVLRVRAHALSGAEDLPVRFTITRAVGALATATGDDAAITTSTSTHLLTLRKRDVQFSVAPSTVDVGAVAVGQSGTAAFTVSNNGAAGSLTVSSAASSNPLFSVTPASAVLAAGGRQEFTVSFSPTSLLFGRQTATVTLTHNGTSGTAAVEVAGRGQGGRGDAHQDGMVELMDLVYLLDAILGRTAPSAAQRDAVDLYPFSAGDDALDIRDATVLAHAVVNGLWPDGYGLPAILPTAPAGKHALARAGEDTVHLAPSEDGTRLHVRHTVPIQGLQVIVSAEDMDALQAASVAGATLLFKPDASAGVARFVLFRADGNAIAPGAYTLAVSNETGHFRQAGVLYATAVDTLRERLPVRFGAIAPGDTTGLPEPPAALDFGAPYPNPYLASGAAPLRLPVALPEAAHTQILVYDLLGRTVATILDREQAAGMFTLEWDGRDTRGMPAPPGVYLLRLTAGSASATRTVVLMR